MKKKSAEPKPARTPRKSVTLGIIGTGAMANYHASQLAGIPGCRVVAACDVDGVRVRDFAARHDIPEAFTDLKEFLARGKFDAICNVTPDRFHTPVSLACLRAGRHVLCEKPLATNYRDARKMAVAASAAGVVHMVNFSYRNSAAVQRAAAMVAAGDLGRIMHVDASYYQDWLCADHWGNWKTSPNLLWRLSTGHGSAGVLGDIGVHLLDFASFPVGPIASVNCLLKTFAKAPGGRVDDYILDANDSAVITATFAGGAVGALQTSRWTTGHQNSVALSIYGDEGALRIDLNRSYTEFELCRIKKRERGLWKTVSAKATPSMWQRFVRSIVTGTNDQPDFHRGAEIQKALDACLKSNQTGKTVPLS
jgi:predicted dehydrogenase